MSSSNQDLFENEQETGYRPLADRMRPNCLEDIVGQQHLLEAGKSLGESIRKERLHSMILWGPPGTGKTTLARMIAKSTSAQFLSLSAVLSGVKDIRQAIEQAQQHQLQYHKKTILFVDEVHRFNKSQQDAFLPHVEDGTVTFIGATTENPSFELNNALLSRARVYVLKSITDKDLAKVIQRALDDRECGIEQESVSISDEALSLMTQLADGDARRALNMLEISVDLARKVGDAWLIDKDVMQAISQPTLHRFDKHGEAFYDQISAMHKSVRGSAPDAALYWMVRMLDGGCDPVYLARRLVRMASEDIGNADPRALQLCLNAWDVQERLGHPEGELALAQAVLYLASVPKSNAVYKAYNTAVADIKDNRSHEVPIHLRNAPTKLMKELGYGHAYRYAHDEAHAYAAGEQYFPEEMGERSYYNPTSYGLEKNIGERLNFLRSLDEKEFNQ